MSATFLLLILLGVGRSMTGRRLLPTGDTELTGTITSPLDQIDTAEKGRLNVAGPAQPVLLGGPAISLGRNPPFPAGLDSANNVVEAATIIPSTDSGSGRGPAPLVSTCPS